MFIKKGDKVVVITGKDKGKVGTVIEAQPKKDRVVVEGVNIIKKHVKKFSRCTSRWNRRKRSSNPRIKRNVTRS